MKNLTTLFMAISFFAPVCLLGENCDVACCKSPTVVKYQQPEVPADLLKPGESAEIVIRCAIDRQGKLIGTKTVTSSHEQLEASVVTAIQNWTFDASLEKGEPRRATINIPFKVTLAAK